MDVRVAHIAIDIRPTDPGGCVDSVNLRGFFGFHTVLTGRTRDRIQSQAMIWLLRHGEAEDGSPDAERPLTEKGERQARAAGAALKALGVDMSACLTSPRARAPAPAKPPSEPLGIEFQLEPKLAGGPFSPEE